MGGKQIRRWNHNIRLVLDQVPVDARSALDVGTGNGLLAADLRQKVPDVVAIDVDDDVLQAAREEADNVEWILGDVMAYPFRRTFDVVASVAALHHLPDLTLALRRLAELTSPGGVLVVIGLARSTRPWDFAVGLVGVVQHQWLSWRRSYWGCASPAFSETSEPGLIMQAWRKEVCSGSEQEVSGRAA